MKYMNWGTGIFAFYSLFVVALLFQVWKSTQYDNSLVSKDYYAKDLTYQEHYEKLQNAKQLPRDVQVVNDEQGLHIIYPEGFQQISGEILFFSPIDSDKDFTVAVAPGPEGKQEVVLGAIRRGKWKVKIDWKGDGRAFFTEQSIVL